MHAYSGSTDLFVLELSSSGAYQWHTFYGSSSDDEYGLSVTVDGSIYVAGYSATSWAGPSGESPLHAKSGDWTTEDLFVLKLAQ